MIPLPAELPGGAIAVPTEGGLIAQWNQKQSQWQSSFADETTEGFNLRLRCLGKEDVQLMTLPGQPIIVKDWFLHQIKLVDQATGEEVETLRLILVTPEGKTISSCSLWFCQNWGDVVSRFGRRTLNPYLRIKIKLVPGRQMGHFPQLDWVEPLTPGEMTAYTG